jgi:hypothetical protein
MYVQFVNTYGILFSMYFAFDAGSPNGHNSYVVQRAFALGAVRGEGLGVVRKPLLQKNQTNGVETMLSSAAREGLAPLQGVLICGVCGRRMTVRYKGNGGLYPSYECNWRKREGSTENSCLTFHCDIVDQATMISIKHFFSLP